MKSTALLTHFRLMSPELSLAPEAKRHEEIELSAFGAPTPVQQAPRSSRAGNPIATIPALLMRECKQLHATFVAGAREAGKWFDTFRRKAERLLAPPRRRTASMKTSKALCSQTTVRCNVPLAPARAMRANAALLAGKPHPGRAQAGTMGAHCDSQPSVHRPATLREVLRNDQREMPPAGKFVTRINQLCNTNKLEAQLHELNLAELKLLWSHLGSNGRASLAPKANKMLRRTGNALLCIGFKEDARAFRLESAQEPRQLPDWAAKAPAEWNPKVALKQAYGMQAQGQASDSRQAGRELPHHRKAVRKQPLQRHREIGQR